MLSLNTIPLFIWEDLTSYVMNVNPVLKNQSVFARAITKLTLSVSGFLYASHKPGCRVFSKKLTFTLPTWCTESYCHFTLPIYHSLHPEELYHLPTASLKTSGKASDLQ